MSFRATIHWPVLRILTALNTIAVEPYEDCTMAVPVTYDYSILDNGQTAHILTSDNIQLKLNLNTDIRLIDNLLNSVALN